jgi:hypothetical protein
VAGINRALYENRQLAKSRETVNAPCIFLSHISVDKSAAQGPARRFNPHRCRVRRKRPGGDGLLSMSGNPVFRLQGPGSCAKIILRSVAPSFPRDLTCVRPSTAQEREMASVARNQVVGPIQWKRQFEFGRAYILIPPPEANKALTASSSRRTPIWPDVKVTQNCITFGFYPFRFSIKIKPRRWWP